MSRVHSVARAGFNPTAGTPFHPTVVVQLDDEGRRIGAYLADLLACLPPAVRGWVEQLDVAPALEGPAASEPEPPDQLRLESALAGALGRITNVHLRDDVRRAGYYAGDAVPVMLLVGHTTAPLLLPAARAARVAMSHAFPRALRLAVLSDSRPTERQAAQQQDVGARAQPWEALLGWTGPESGGEEPPVALCLLYQDYDERSWHWNVADGDGEVRGPGGDAADGARDAEDVRYAVAEALFALIAAGLLDEPELREHLRLTMPTVPGGGGEAARRFGSLATSRMAFPRAQAERACASFEGATLLEAWLRESERFEQALGERGGRVGRSAAVRFARQLHEVIADSDRPEYLRGGVASPPLSAEGISRLYGLEAAQVDPARIFATFGRREIGREVAASGAPLGAALDALDARARLRFARWREAAAEVWDADAAQRRAGMAAQVDAELAEGPAGLARARAYLRELRQALVLVRERQEDDERLRAASLQRDLREMEDEAYDRLAISPPAGRAPTAHAPSTPVSQVANVPADGNRGRGTLERRSEEQSYQAHASGLPHPSTPVPSAIAVSSPWAATASTGGASPQTSPGVHTGPRTGGSQASAPRLEGTEMPERLRRLADALGRHLSARGDSQPAGATLVAAVIMVLPFLGYAAVALGAAVPLHLPVVHLGAALVPLNAVATGLLLALAVALPPALIYQRRVEEVRLTRRLLVRAHVRWWAEVCGREEDGLRRKTLAALAAAIEERLTAVTAFEERLRTATEQLRAAGDGVERELERGPAGRRDVFVIGGRRFPAVRLGDFYRALRQRRAEHPVDVAHTDDAALGAAFRRHLQASDRPLLAYTTDELAAQATAFGAEACRPYISGEMAVVTPALHLGAPHDDPERVALGTLLERATPLFRPLSTESPRRVTALAAPDDVLLVGGVAQGSGLIAVSTPSPEWLMVAQLVSQARPRWWRRRPSQRPPVQTRVEQQPAASMAATEE